MSWLKSFGLALLKGLQIVAGIEPLIQPIIQQAAPGAASTVQTVENTLTNVAGIVQTAEGMFAAVAGSTGAQKFAAAAPFVQQEIQTWLAANFPGTPEVGDQTLFTKGCGEVEQGVVDILNSLKNQPKTTTVVKT